MSRAALITGASSGLGRGLALELAQRGWDVALTARRARLLEELKEELLQASGGRARVETAALDVTDHARVLDAVRSLDEALGGLEVVVANAGVSGDKAGGLSSMESDLSVLNTNLLGAVATLRVGADVLKARGRGKLVGVSSIAGLRGVAGCAAYSASKAGLSTYMEALRGELRGTGVRVMSLRPGYVDTPMNQHLKRRPFVISCEDASRMMADWIEQGGDRGVLPRWPWMVLGWTMKVLPDAVWDRFNKP